jgi:hypothetical protein
VVGFLLGLIQILPELKRDRWAALLHRPVSRGVILRGKVVAGLILYAVATVLPFLYFVWQAATPGHFAAPFVPGMVQPGVADTSRDHADGRCRPRREGLTGRRLRHTRLIIPP